MNDQQMENKIRQDSVKLKNDVSTWVEGGVSQLSQGFEKLSGEAKGTVDAVAEKAKRDVEQGLNQYNSKAQKFAEKVPGGFAKKAAKYPWVAISLTLALGLLLGCLLKPSRKTLW
jgi:ElaB/YqjD/DUF883 family membrane-anchored ribosome-binding protein